MSFGDDTLHPDNYVAEATDRDVILHEIDRERERQDKKWGVQNHPDGTSFVGYAYARNQFRALCDYAHERGKQTWLNILQEEVYEAFAEEDPEKLEEELIQVAAVAVSWIEAIRRRKNGNK